MMFNSIIILFLVATIRIAQSQEPANFIFISDELPFAECVTVHNYAKVSGSCVPIERCPSVLARVLKRINTHNICGYEGFTQIVCCPNFNNQKPPVKINLYKNLECQVPDSNVSGVMKFMADCPAFNNKSLAANETNKICDYEICSDLVCCPATTKTRLKNVCRNVDAPGETLDKRLLENRKCTVKELNREGTYQTSCGFADRNPHLKSILQNVCNDEIICSNWYCCPIEDVDHFYCTAIHISSTLATLVGPKCIDSKSGRQGTCKRDCPGIAHKNLDKCGSYCCHDFYCCPEPEISLNQPISARECISYTKYLSKEQIEVPMNGYINQTYCLGFSLPAAAGGRVVSPGDYPHMAALGYESNQIIKWNCGGSLISDRFVLTAAHCLTNRNAGEVKKVRLGVIDLLNDENMADCPEEFDVARSIPYPEYNPVLVYNDIGLIEVVGRVTFNFHIRPICLPTSADIPVWLESMGWGALGPTEDQSDKLIVVKQELFSHEECHEHYEINRRLKRGIQQDTQLCAGSRDSIQSTCRGDSGGPLLARHQTYFKLFYIYGVVSYGTVCGFVNSPGVYTKVFPYTNWIEGIVWSN